MKRLVALLAMLLISVSWGIAQDSVSGNITATGTTCGTTNACVQLTLNSNTGTVGMLVTGTWTATLQFEGSNDASTWAAVDCVPVPSAASAQNTTANGTWTCSVAGLSAMRVRASAYTSGTAAVKLRTSPAARASAAPLGVSSGGTGLTGGTSGGILGFTGPSTLASSVALTAGALVVGGGAGATPTPLSLGSADALLGVNAAGTAHEYKAITARTGTASGTDYTLVTIPAATGAATGNVFGLNIADQTVGTNYWNIWSGAPFASLGTGGKAYTVGAFAANVFAKTGNFASLVASAQGTSGTDSPEAIVGVVDVPVATAGTASSGDFQAYVYNPSGIVSRVQSLYTYLEQAGAGTVTDLIGLHVDSNSKSAGTVTNNYGLLIENQAIAGATNYAVKTGTGQVALGDYTTLAGRTINTDADLTVNALYITGSYTKNDANTRSFSHVKIKPTLNFGASNTTTTVNVLEVDTTNTAVTGATTNLLKLSYGGTQKAIVDSNGGSLFTSVGVGTTFQASASYIIVGSGMGLVWKNNASIFAGALDLGIVRGGVGAVKVSNGSTGGYLTLGANVPARNPTANTAGTAGYIASEGATVAATDKAGGALILAPGVSTGTGLAKAQIQRYSRASSTATADNAASDAFIAPSPLNLADNSAATVFTVALAAGAYAGCTFAWTVESSDGTDFQVRSGLTTLAAANKGGVYSTTITDVAANQAFAETAAGSTLAVSWAVTTGASIINVQVTANSSLTPTTLRVSYNILNATNATITPQ